MVDSTVDSNETTPRREEVAPDHVLMVLDLVSRCFTLRTCLWYPLLLVFCLAALRMKQGERAGASPFEKHRDPERVSWLFFSFPLSGFCGGEVRDVPPEAGQSQGRTTAKGLKPHPSPRTRRMKRQTRHTRRPRAEIVSRNEANFEQKAWPR